MGFQKKIVFIFRILKSESCSLACLICINVLSYLRPDTGEKVSNTMNFVYFRVMQDRREQARQDLKGLEETVVSCYSKYISHFQVLNQ